MTRSLMLLELPRAGANSKHHVYEKKDKKWRSFRKHGFQRENSLKISDEKEQLQFSNSFSWLWHG